MSYYYPYIPTGVHHVPIGTDVQLGDEVYGAGIPQGCVVTAVNTIAAIPGAWNQWQPNPIYYEIKIYPPINIFHGSSPVKVSLHPGIISHNYETITGYLNGESYGGWSSAMGFKRYQVVKVLDEAKYEGGVTLSFKEDVKGWVSFKSFIPQNGVSCANNYYTYNEGSYWEHNKESADRNTFYNTYTNSAFTLIINNTPGTVKSFKALSYEGSQARVLENLDINLVTIADGEYYNLTPERGWFVGPDQANDVGQHGVETDIEKGGVDEFVEKEGKWFGNFTGINPNINDDGLVITFPWTHSSDGIGVLDSVTIIPIIGCTDLTAMNYNPAATSDDGSCIATVPGCMNPLASNYNPIVNTSDGSCVFLGCTDASQFNYDNTATVDDGSCTPFVYGCIDPTAFNYSGTANTQDINVPCVATELGCTDPSMFNFSGTANVDDGSCVSIVFGCTDINATNFSALVNTDNGTCSYCVYGCMDASYSNFNSLATCPGFCSTNFYGCLDPIALNYNAAVTVDDGSCLYPVYGCMDPTSCNYDSLATFPLELDPTYTPGDPICQFCSDPTANNTDTSTDPSCTSGCNYCYSPVTLAFTSITQNTLTVLFDPDPNTFNNALTTGYYISIDGVLHDTATSANSGNWSGSTISFEINGLIAGTTYNIGVQRTCGGSDMAGITADVTTMPVPTVNGCMDSTGTLNPYGAGVWGACNFNPLANFDDGTFCDYDSCRGCGNVANLGYCGDCWNATLQQACITGSLDPDCGAFVGDYVTTACGDVIVSGCTDASQFNYDPTANVDDGSCIAIVLGCMDDTLNYNGDYSCSNYAGPNTQNVLGFTPVIPEANTDDGLCADYNCQGYPHITTYFGDELRVEFWFGNTPYDYNVSWDGYINSIDGFTSTLDIVDASGASLFSGAPHWGVYTGAWGNSPSSGMAAEQDLEVIIGSSAFQGLTSVTVTASTTALIQPSCVRSTTETFTIGCNDPSMDITYNPGLGNFDFNDQSQCVINGCMDDSFIMNSDGTAGNSIRSANNYDQFAGVDDNGAGASLCEYDDPIGVGYTVSNSGTLNAGDVTMNLTYNVENTVYTSGKINNYHYPSGTTNNLGTRYTVSTSTYLHNNTLDLYDASGPEVTQTDGSTVDASNNQLTNQESGIIGGNPFQISGTAVFTAVITHPTYPDYTKTFTQTDLHLNNGLSFTFGCKHTGALGASVDSNIDPAAAYYNHDPSLDMHQVGSCLESIGGCMDPTANNYDATATFSDASYGTDGCYYACDVPTGLCEYNGGGTNYGAVNNPNNSYTFALNYVALGITEASNVGVQHYEVTQYIPTSSTAVPAFMQGVLIQTVDYTIATSTAAVNPQNGLNQYNFEYDSNGVSFFYFGSDYTNQALQSWETGSKPDFKVRAFCLAPHPTIPNSDVIESSAYSSAAAAGPLIN